MFSCEKVFFFFQAEDGIRDVAVTGVQTCALPISYEGEVKVVDFGIAKAASKSEHTKTGMLKGKFSYMSPEQCQGERVDRSEERRVGKEWRYSRSTHQSK